MDQNPYIIMGDGVAQWIMAFLAVVNVIVSAWAVWLVYGSLELNRKAVKAAEDAVAEARRSSEVQSRAWLSIECSITRMPATQTQDGRQGLYFNIEAISHNHGNSPATSVSFRAEVALFGDACPSIEDCMARYCDDMRRNAREDAETVFPDEDKQFSQAVFLSTDEIDQELARREQFKLIAPIIYGCVSYRTPYTEGVRQTRFAYYVTSMNEGQSVVIMQDGPDWLDRPMVLMRPALIVAD